MRQLPTFPDHYWQKFSEKPVVLADYNPQSKVVAQRYLHELQAELSSFSFDSLYHRGSTAMGIAGKGEIELGVVPVPDNWFPMIIFLSNKFRGIGNLDEEYCRFNDNCDGFEIELILLRGYTAELDKKLHAYLLGNPALLADYVKIKYRHSGSKREYMRAKDTFLRQVIDQIPESFVP